MVVNLNMRLETWRAGTMKFYSTTGFKLPVGQVSMRLLVIFQHLGVLARHHENDALSQIGGAVADALQVVGDP